MCVRSEVSKGLVDGSDARSYPADSTALEMLQVTITQG